MPMKIQNSILIPSVECRLQWGEYAAGCGKEKSTIRLVRVPGAALIDH